MTNNQAGKLLELAAVIADEQAAKHRKIASECIAWSAAQAEHMRAKDCAMNIADAIRALAQEHQS